VQERLESIPLGFLLLKQSPANITPYQVKQDQVNDGNQVEVEVGLQVLDLFVLRELGQIEVGEPGEKLLMNLQKVIELLVAVLHEFKA
jgi:hypothetical protein